MASRSISSSETRHFCQPQFGRLRSSPSYASARRSGPTGANAEAGSALILLLIAALALASVTVALRQKEAAAIFAVKSLIAEENGETSRRQMLAAGPPEQLRPLPLKNRYLIMSSSNPVTAINRGPQKKYELVVDVIPSGEFPTGLELSWARLLRKHTGTSCLGRASGARPQLFSSSKTCFDVPGTSPAANEVVVRGNLLKSTPLSFQSSPAPTLMAVLGEVSLDTVVFSGGTHVLAAVGPLAIRRVLVPQGATGVLLLISQRSYVTVGPLPKGVIFGCGNEEEVGVRAVTMSPATFARGLGESPRNSLWCIESIAQPYALREQRGMLFSGRRE